MSLAISQRAAFSATSYLRLAEAMPAATSSSKQISEIFLSSAPIEAPAADLSEKQVVSFTNLWKDPFTAIIGGLWSLLLVYDIYCVAESGSKLISSMQEGAGSESSLISDQFKDLKKFLLDGVSLVGVTANIGDWAHREKIISLGEAASSFKMVGYGASCITCSVRAFANGKEVLERLEEFKGVQNDAELARLEQKQLLSCLDFAGDSATALWAFMGIATMVAGIVVAPAWLIGLFNVAGILAISSLCYRIHLSNIYATVRQTAEAV